MIHVTRLNHTPVVLNSDLIEHIEMTPDTVVSLTNGQKIMVLESTDEIIERVIKFRRSISSHDGEQLVCSLSGQSGGGPHGEI